VTLIGAEAGPDGALVRLDLDEVAARAGTVNYEILCGLSKRVPRLYRDEQGGPAAAPQEEARALPAGSGSGHP
jgi:hypothetical protein